MLSPYNKTEECACFSIDNASDPFIMSDVIVIGQEYTLSFWAQAVDSEFNLTVCDQLLVIDTTWTKHVITFIATNTNITWSFADTGTYYIYHPQLEIGNKATDWTPSPEDIDESIINSKDEIRTEMLEQSATIQSSFDEILLSALETYVETSDYETFKQTMETQLSITSGEMETKFTEVKEQTEIVNGELQTFLTTFSKYIKFASDTAITIGSGDSVITLEIDNETGIVFKKNGVQFGWWDGIDFHTGNIVVDVYKRAQFGNFAYEPRDDGSLSFLKVTS